MEAWLCFINLFQKSLSNWFSNNVRVAIIAQDQYAWLDVYLRLVGQEGDVDLRQCLDGFGSAALHQLVEQRIRAGWQGEIEKNRILVNS